MDELMDERTRMPPPCVFTVTQLLMAWTALREGQISLKELRVYFALAALRSGQRRAQDEAAPQVALRDLRALVGGEYGPRQAVGKLLAVGLLRAASPSTLEFATDPSELHFEPATLAATLSRLSRPRRLVAVPRATVQLMARGARRSLIATLLGHLMCCPKRGVSDPEGYVKASWIGQVFGVSERIVKAQRRRLVALGWLLPRQASQRTLNLQGGCFAINLGWTAAVLATESLGLSLVQEQSPAPAPLPG